MKLAMFLIVGIATTAFAASGLDHLPRSPIGQHARAWFAAYDAATDEAIANYARDHVAPGQATPAQRAERMRGMKAEHGALTVVSVPMDDDRELAVVVRDEHGDTLSLSFLAQPAPPYLLTGMRVVRGATPEIAQGPPLDDAGCAAAVRAEIARRPDFSGVVLVARGDRVLVAEARGLADRAAGTKVALDTKFNIASIGKIFTRLALAQLAASGKLALADPIVRWLPDYRVEGAPKITLAQLAEHRGGVDDVLDRVHEVHDRTTLTTLAGWLSLIEDRPLVFEPGTSQRYSNGGYVLLGGAIAQASGEDYYDYVQRHVLDPAGMADTGWPLAHQPLARRAEGYTRHREGLRHAEAQSASASAETPIRDLLPERGSPAGGATSTAPDLLKFMRAMRASRLAPVPWSAWVLGGPEPSADAPGEIKKDYGFGIAGGSPGVNGVMEFEGAYDVIVLTNADPPNAEELARALRGLLRRAPQR